MYVFDDFFVVYVGGYFVSSNDVDGFCVYGDELLGFLCGIGGFFDDVVCSNVNGMFGSEVWEGGWCGSWESCYDVEYIVYFLVVGKGVVYKYGMCKVVVGCVECEYVLN